ncbi:MAG: hypothetical protein ABEI97_00700 [Candidatus Nanohaloarchaea archaeon]
MADDDSITADDIDEFLDRTDAVYEEYGENEWPCPFCEDVAGSQAELGEHIVSRHNEKVENEGVVDSLLHGIRSRLMKGGGTDYRDPSSLIVHIREIDSWEELEQFRNRYREIRDEVGPEAVKDIDAELEAKREELQQRELREELGIDPDSPDPTGIIAKIRGASLNHPIEIRALEEWVEERTDYFSQQQVEDIEQELERKKRKLEELQQQSAESGESINVDELVAMAQNVNTPQELKAAENRLSDASNKVPPAARENIENILQQKRHMFEEAADQLRSIRRENPSIKKQRAIVMAQRETGATAAAIEQLADPIFEEELGGSFLTDLRFEGDTRIAALFLGGVILLIFPVVLWVVGAPLWLFPVAVGIAAFFFGESEREISVQNQSIALGGIPVEGRLWHFPVSLVFTAVWIWSFGTVLLNLLTARWQAMIGAGVSLVGTSYYMFFGTGISDFVSMVKNIGEIMEEAGEGLFGEAVLSLGILAGVLGAAASFISPLSGVQSVLIFVSAVLLGPIHLFWLFRGVDVGASERDDATEDEERSEGEGGGPADDSDPEVAEEDVETGEADD